MVSKSMQATLEAFHAKYGTSVLMLPPAAFKLLFFYFVEGMQSEQDTADRCDMSIYSVRKYHKWLVDRTWLDR